VILGHLGEGNLHLVVSVGSADKIVREQVGGIVYGALREHRDSVLGEHGIGLEKRAYLEVTRAFGRLVLIHVNQLLAALVICFSQAKEPSKNLPRLSSKHAKLKIPN